MREQTRGDSSVNRMACGQDIRNWHPCVAHLNGKINPTKPSVLPHSLQPWLPSLPLPSIPTLPHVDFICWNNILPLFSQRGGASANWQQFSHLLFLAALLLFLTRQIGQISAGGRVTVHRWSWWGGMRSAGLDRTGTSAYTYGVP